MILIFDIDYIDFFLPFSPLVGPFFGLGIISVVSLGGRRRRGGEFEPSESGSIITIHGIINHK